MNQPNQAPQGPGNMNALIDALGRAKVGNDQSQRLNAGHTYVIDVGAVELKKTYYGDRFIVSFGVVESDDPAIPPGSEGYSWAKATQDQYGHGPNDIKEWICLFLESVQPGSNPGALWNQPDPSTGRPYGEAMVRWILDSHPAVGSRWCARTTAKAVRNPKPGGSDTILIVRWEVMPPGSSLGLTAPVAAPAAAPAQWASPAPVAAAAPAWAAPAAAAPAAAPGFGARPPGYPAHLPWPPTGFGG